MTDLTEHWRKLYANNYLGAWDLHVGGQYRELRATIERVTYEPVTRPGGAKDRILLLHLRGPRKPVPVPMCLSKTNGKAIAAMYGDAPSGWVGKQITIYAQSKRLKDGPAYVLTIRNERASSSLAERLAEEAGPRLDVADLGSGTGSPTHNNDGDGYGDDSGKVDRVGPRGKDEQA